MQVETMADVKVFWLYTVRPLGLQHGSPMTLFTDRSKWTSICSSCLDKLKKGKPKSGAFHQDFIKIPRNTMGILRAPEESPIWGRKGKGYLLTCGIHFIPVQSPLG